MPTKAPYKRAFHPSVGPCLVPTTQEGLDQIAALKADKEVMCNLHAPRNMRHHKLFFVLLRKVIDGGAWEDDEDSLRDAVKYATGYVRRSVDFDGKVHLAPRSMAVEKMPQDAFNRFFDRACFYISTRLLGSDKWEALRDEIVEAVDGDHCRQAKELAARYG